MLASGAGCARIPSPPYALAFTQTGASPRVLRSFEETVVPLTIANAGPRAWDPSRVHVSYHWLWLIPRELARRSRTVPYHDGIRTELADVVSPGATATVEARLLAPPFPGLYWLQWDMVEEGVTWFSQVSPRQSRQLVVVVPSLAGLFAPLPLAVALGGLFAIGISARGRPWPRLVAAAPFTDLMWCAAALLSKSLLLGRQALLELTAQAHWLVVVAAAVPPLFCWVIFRRRIRAWVLLACGALGTLVLFGDALYYRFFGDVLSASALLGARQTGQVWESIRSLLTPGMFWFVADLPFAVWLMWALAKLPAGSPLSLRYQRMGAATLLALVAAGGIVSGGAVIRRGTLDQVFRDRAVMEQLGPFGYHAYDAWSFARSTFFRPRPAPDEIARARTWFAERSALRAGRGSLFGAAAGKNLVVIQVESLQGFVVDYRIAGQDVMPTLRRWAQDGLRFTNVTDQTNQGRTSDAEFTTLVSLLPLEHGAVAFRFSANHYMGFPRVLAEHGYSTLSAVPFESGFWNRRVMHPSYGFRQSLFEPDFQMTDQIGWGLNDRDFLQQMVPRLNALPRPFAAWLITLSLHHPFDAFPEKHKTLKLGPLEGTSFGNFLHTMRFFDHALAEFKTALEREGLLDDTLLVVFGDHDAGFQRDAALARTMGVVEGETSWELNDRVPFLVRLPTKAPGSTGVVSIPAGQTDFAPTLLSILGIDAAPFPYIGRNLLGQPDDSPVLRPYGDWLNRRHLFLDRPGFSRGRSCYALAPARFVADAACAAANESARRARDIARLVVVGDLQEQLADALR